MLLEASSVIIINKTDQQKLFKLSLTSVWTTELIIRLVWNRVLILTAWFQIGYQILGQAIISVAVSLRSLAVFKQFEGAREAESSDKERQSREEPGIDV